MFDQLPKKCQKDVEFEAAEHDAGSPFIEYVKRQQQAARFPKKLQRSRDSNPNWTEEQHVAHVTQRLFRGHALLLRGYAARFLHDRPEELARSASTFGRLRYWWGTQNENGSCLTYSDDLLRTLASGDTALFERYTEVTPPFAEESAWDAPLLHAGVTAVISRDRDRLAESISRFESWTKPKKYIACLYRALAGLLHEDQKEVVAGLDAMVATSPKINQLYDLFKHLCLEPHGLYELCRWYNADLVAGFDTDRGLPWDAGLYRWVRENEGNAPHFDFTEASPALQEWLVELPFRDDREHYWPE